jgi:hypothetical protein
MRLDRFERLVRDETITVFVTGAHNRSVPIGIDFHPLQFESS